jgi:hypothetical protein
MAVTRKVTPDQESLHEMDTQAVAEIVVQEIGIFVKYLNIYRNTIGDLVKETAERRAETMSMTLDKFPRSNTQNLGRTTLDGTKFLLNNFMTLGRESMDIWLKSVVLSHGVIHPGVACNYLWSVRPVHDHGEGHRFLIGSRRAAFLWFYAAIGRSRACSSSRRNSGCGARHMVRYVSRKGSQL